MADHELRKESDQAWVCSVCLKTWKEKPYAGGCPGLPVYALSKAPEHLATRKQLQALRLRPGGPVRGLLAGKRDLWKLFDKNEAVAIRPISEKQRAALAAGRALLGTMICPGCGERVSIEWIHPKKGICETCVERRESARLRRMWMKDRDVAIAWARETLSNANCVVLDTETTGLERAEVVQVAVMSVAGEVLLNSLVKPLGEISAGALAVHGISCEMVQGAPAWPEVFGRLTTVLDGKTVVAYNSDFDWGAVRYSCRVNEVPAEGLLGKWHDAMVQYAAFVGEWNERHKDWRWQSLPNANHDALGDCAALLALLGEMAGAKLSSEEAA